MKILAAGPWVGEFGWELFEWQGFIRHKSKDYDKVAVSSRPGHEILYKDFCDKFIPFSSNISSCCGWTNYLNELVPNPFQNLKNVDIIKPGKYLEGKQKFVSYGEPQKELEYDIVVHARYVEVFGACTDKKKSDKEFRNWSIDNWSKLINFFLKRGFRICSIGQEGAAKHIPGTDNRLGIDLSDLSDILASSKLCIGPSSGPMHFASLCKCPHYVWTSSRNIEKYKETWNPLQTPVYLHIIENWKPRVRTIRNEIEEICNDLT